MKRRCFNKSLLLGASIASSKILGNGFDFSNKALPIDNKELVERVSKAPPIYCIAHINPTLEDQKGQEELVSRFPIAIVPQDMHREHKKWRDRIRELNPNIVFLAYQMTIEETTARGPGHDRMRRAQSSWNLGRDGSPVTIEWRGKIKRVYDPRTSEWQDAFVEACGLTIESDGYEGVFIDQCNVYRRILSSGSEYKEQMIALREAVWKVRKAWPDKLIVANSPHKFDGTNGEMNEGRISSWGEEFEEYSGHFKPNMNMAAVLLKNKKDYLSIPALLKRAIKYDALFYACESYQKIYWDPAYDNLDSLMRAPKPVERLKAR